MSETPQAVVVEHIVADLIRGLEAGEEPADKIFERFTAFSLVRLGPQGLQVFIGRKADLQLPPACQGLSLPLSGQEREALDQSHQPARESANPLIFYHLVFCLSVMIRGIFLREITQLPGFDRLG